MGTFDFGDESARMLVPGSIRAVRVFRLYYEDSQQARLYYGGPKMGLYSMVHRETCWKPGGWTYAECDVVKVHDTQGVSRQFFCPSCVDVSRYALSPQKCKGLREGLSKLGVAEGWVDYEYWCVCDDTVNRLSHASIRASLAHEDRAPNKGCFCGLYAAYNINELAGSPGCLPLRGISVMGVVEAAGKVVLGERGLRAEKMRVLALSNHVYPHPFLDVAGKMYDVPTFSGAEEMMRAFPLNNNIEELVK